MATSLDTLIKQVRRFVRDWPEEDVLTASMSSTTSIASVAVATDYADGWLLEIDQEVLGSLGFNSGTDVKVRRGLRGSTAASHASLTTVLVRPTWLLQDYVDALNWAKNECFPKIYKDALDTSLTTLANTYEYTIPSIGGLPMRYVSKVEFKAVGAVDYREVREYSIRRGATPKLQFLQDQDAGQTIRIHGYSPFPDIALGGSLDTQWPAQGDRLLVLGAASYLLASEESGRGRSDRPARQAQNEEMRAGARMNQANALDTRFRRSMVDAALPPLPIHARPTF